MIDHRAHGILYSTWYHRVVDAPESLRTQPTVFVNCLSAADGSYSVIPDEVQGGRTATDALLARGHRRIALVNAPENSPSTLGRLKGYKDALKAHGVPFDPRLVLKADPEQEGGYAAASRLLDMAPTPSAVFSYNDRVAMGLYDRVKEAGMSIPGDLAVIGFDDQEVIAAHLRPALSSVAPPHHDIGVRPRSADPRWRDPG